MLLGDSAKEIDELREVELEYPLFAPKRVDMGGLRLSKDDADHRVRDIELALAGKGHTLLQNYKSLAVMSEVIEGLLQHTLVFVEDLRDPVVLNQLLSELVSVNASCID